MKMKTLNLLQMIFEILVISGYAVGLFPFGYLLTLWWVIPMTIANLVFSGIEKNKTLNYTITNVIMAWLGIIPILGYAARITGIVMSIFSIKKLANLK
jgi:hypothetical protein